jgi:hypothetical protein
MVRICDAARLRAPSAAALEEMARMANLELAIDHEKIEAIKEQRRRLWHYRRVDHIPVDMELYPHYLSDVYTARRRYEEFDVWFECNFEAVRKSLALVPEDYIPWAGFLSRGSVTLPTMFGAEVLWGPNPHQDPFVEPVLTDVEQVYELSLPDPHRDGIMPENLEWTREFARRFPRDVHIAAFDFEGPMAVASMLLGAQRFYGALKGHPKEIHHLLDLVTRAIIACEEAFIEAAGGSERLTSINDHVVWQPEDCKGALSDDTCANVSPAMFEEFSIPYNNRIYARWGGGLIHNCGPNPSAHLYLHHDPPLRGYNCSYQYSKDDLDALREALGPRAQETLGYRGHLQALIGESGCTGEEMVAAFRDMMEHLAPDVYAIPSCYVEPSMWSDDDITQLYWEMRKVGEEYATNVRWDD